MRLSNLERFRAKYEVQPDGCWRWTAQINQNGYAIFSIKSRNMLAHRWSYETFVGPIPDGLGLDHLCHSQSDCPPGKCLHRRCVNPTHLLPVTAAENVPNPLAQCPAGHDFDEANTYRPKRGSYMCRACHRERVRVAALRKRALADNPCPHLQPLPPPPSARAGRR